MNKIAMVVVLVVAAQMTVTAKDFVVGEKTGAAIQTAVDAAAKAANPNVRVAMGGLAGWSLPFLDSLYKEGLKDCCDIVNVHPYSYPHAPEGPYRNAFRKLREQMARYGDAGKPVWFTEVGWPTHDVSLAGPGNFVSAALKAARPDAVFVEPTPADIAREVYRQTNPLVFSETTYGVKPILW